MIQGQLPQKKKLHEGNYGNMKHIAETDRKGHKRPPQHDERMLSCICVIENYP